MLMGQSSLDRKEKGGIGEMAAQLHINVMWAWEPTQVGKTKTG